MRTRRQTVPDAREHPRREGLWPLFISREDLVEELLLAVTRRLPGALAALAMEDRPPPPRPARFRPQPRPIPPSADGRRPAACYPPAMRAAAPLLLATLGLACATP